MSEIHLTRSPIREALIDFRFNFSEPVDIKKLELAHEKLKDLYPNKEIMDVNSLFFDMAVGNKPKIETTQGKVGYRFISSSKDIVIQFRIDGFTFSKLTPYTSWENVLEKAKYAYDIYLSVVSATNVNRIATRYINFIDVTTEKEVDVKKYLNVYPNFPESISLPIDNFLMRVAMKDKSISATSILNQGIVVEPKVNTFTKYILFDIDTYKENISIKPSDIWSDLQQVKDLTNKLFFNGITDFTKDTFK